jgi:Growth inhibitor
LALLLYVPSPISKKDILLRVEIPAGLKVTGVILSDQVRTIDWNARKVKIVDHIPPECIAEVQEKISKLIL